MAWGVTAAGFARKRLVDVLADVYAALRAAFGGGIRLAADSRYGRLAGVYAAQEASLWEVAEQVFWSQYRATATGVAFDLALAQTGHRRLAAEASQCWCRLDGTQATVVEEPAQVRNPLTGDAYALTADVTIDAADCLRAVVEVVTAEAGDYTLRIDGTDYTYTSVGTNPLAIAAGLRTALNLGYPITAVALLARQVTIGGNHLAEFPVGKGAFVTAGANLGYRTVQARELDGGDTVVTFMEDLDSAAVAGNLRKGLAASSEGFAGPAPPTVYGTLTVVLGFPEPADEAAGYAVDLSVQAEPAPGDLDITSVGSPALIEATATGPKDLAAGVDMEILNAAMGWTGAVTVLAADVGRNRETEVEGRIRVAGDLQVAGASVLGAIRARIAQVANVDSVVVYHNTGDAADSEGRPGHSVEAVVEGGLARDIAQALLEAVAAGIATFGNQSETVYDSEGIPRVQMFSRISRIRTVVEVTVTALHAEEDLPDDAADLVIAAVVDYGDALADGKDVVGQRFIGGIFAAVPGIEAMAVLVDRFGGGGLAPTEAIGPRERAVFDAADVTVVGL